MRLTDVIRDVDLLARLGGDEFVAVLPWTEGAAEAEAVARRRVDAVKVPIAGVHAGAPFEATVGACAGVLHCGGGDLGPAELLELADRAMYAAKAQGRGRVVVADRSAPDGL
jgi:diguanylate cyclase (GGDEF)-like protein